MTRPAPGANQTPLKATVLVVDDEPEIRRAVRAGLIAQGFQVEIAANGDEGLRIASTASPDMVILDLMLPGGVDGLEVCRRLREWSSVPILILSVIGREQQKIAALDLGADDYLTKPFSMGELTARVRAALRRQSAARPQGQPAFAAGDLVVNFADRVVRKAENEIKLTPLEFEILRFLTQNADRVVTHRQLLSAVWGAAYGEDTQLLRVHIGRLRQKLEDVPAHPRYLVTEPGVGYRFRTPEPTS